MGKSEKYKSLPESAKKRMYVSSVIAIIIVGAILVTVGILFLNGTILGTIPRMKYVGVLLFILAAAFAVYMLVSPGIKFNRYSYFIDEDEINIRSGVITHKVSVVPIERLHKIETVAGPIDRHFGLKAVDIYTAGGEVKIEYLPSDEAEKIAELLKKKVNEIVLAQREGK